MTHPVVYVGVGNSDDVLTQVEWSQFVQHTRIAVRRFCSAGLVDDEGNPPPSGGPQLVGDWLSTPDCAWQNACIAFTVPDDTDPELVLALRKDLSQLASRFRQDSISWASAARTVYLTPTGERF